MYVRIRLQNTVRIYFFLPIRVEFVSEGRLKKNGEKSNEIVKRGQVTLRNLVQDSSPTRQFLTQAIKITP